jgi:hypothetical protein
MVEGLMVREAARARGGHVRIFGQRRWEDDGRVASGHLARQTDWELVIRSRERGGSARGRSVSDDGGKIRWMLAMKLGLFPRAPSRRLSPSNIVTCDVCDTVW